MFTGAITDEGVEPCRTQGCDHYMHLATFAEAKKVYLEYCRGQVADFRLKLKTYRKVKEADLL